MENRTPIRVSFVNAFKGRQANIESIRNRAGFGNPASETNSGMEFECLLAASVCIASHMQGLSGIPVADFVYELLFELFSTATPPTDREALKSLLDDSLNNHTIPFLSIPNCSWPDALYSLPKTKFGYLERCKNSDGIDIVATEAETPTKEHVLLTGESKNHKAPLTGTLMSCILEKAGRYKSRIHIIITRKLQDSYSDVHIPERYSPKDILAVEKTSDGFIFKDFLPPHEEVIRVHSTSTRQAKAKVDNTIPKHKVKNLVLFIPMDQ
jgi:hypothetical protein